jgi:hypothetical protein
MLAVGALVVVVSDQLGSRHLLASLLGGAAVLILVAGFALVWWKMDWG